MYLAIGLTFILGYLAIAFEHQIKVNKAASALLTGTVCWTIYILNQPDKAMVSHQLMEHLGDVAGILFFLLGAMTIVELIDAHDGFQIITDIGRNMEAAALAGCGMPSRVATSAITWESSSRPPARDLPSSSR